MSILGVVVRVRPEQAAGVQADLRALPGVELAQRLDPPDGRLVIVIEDTPDCAAAARLAEIALWPQVLVASLVYEHSGEDAGGTPGSVDRYTDWRTTLADLAARR